MTATALPRDNLDKPFEGYPAYGAVHDVMPNEQLRGFMFDYARISDFVFMHKLAGVEVEPLEFTQKDVLAISDDIKADVEDRYDARKYYRIFDVESLGTSVVEMDPSKRHAKLIRSIWERQDFGAVEQEARNEVGRSIPNMHPRLMFNRVDGVGGRLPNVPRTEIRQKVALMPNTAKFQETQKLIGDEAEIVVRAIRRRLKQFVYPWDINPHLTYSVFRSHAGPEQIETILETTNNYLQKYPFAVRLGPLAFRHKTER